LAAQTTLSTALSSFDSEYTGLFGRRGFLMHTEKKGWSISLKKVPAKELPEYFMRLIPQLICDYAQINALTAPRSFVCACNVAWTQAQKLEILKKGDREKGAIYFNSKSEKYFWLSNFFHTLIYVPVTMGDRTEMRLFPHAESAYMGLRFPDHLDACAREMEPSRVKELGSRCIEREEDASLDRRVVIMTLVITSKYAHNPALGALLKGTEERLLVEESSSPFWGNSKGRIKCEETDLPTPVPLDASNVLGRILMQARAALLLPSS